MSLGMSKHDDAAHKVVLARVLVPEYIPQQDLKAYIVEQGYSERDYVFEDRWIAIRVWELVPIVIAFWY